MPRIKNNIITNTDSYKCSQFLQYPPKTEKIFSYIESRGGLYDHTLFFGLQMFIQDYLTDPITQEHIDQAEKLIIPHGEPFNREGWEHILKEHGGYLPIIIRAVPEGTLVPNSNVLVTIENTDPKCFWLTSYLETALLRAIWYPTTVATNSYEHRKLILHYLEQTGTPENVDFTLQDFGSRGVSSFESAGIGGLAHLVSFNGTDTIAALEKAQDYYGADIAGFSIPAAEHSTITAWQRENEVEAYRNMIRQYGKPGQLFACVSDSYNIYDACKIWGTELKQELLDSGATLVVRPDSGDPADVDLKCLKILDQHFGHTVNEKGFKVLNNVRIIQGDGIDHQMIRSILYTITLAGYSADNISFGSGGALLQKVNRDDQKFALKASYGIINGEEVLIRKDPITDPGKRSKAGKLKLIQQNGKYETINHLDTRYPDAVDILQVVFVNGSLVNETTLEEVRKRARASL